MIEKLLILSLVLLVFGFVATFIICSILFSLVEFISRVFARRGRVD